MVASVVGFAEGALGVGGASEFATPNDEGVVEKAALFEVHDESGRTTIGLLATIFHGAWKSAVGIPALVIELDKLDPAFGEAAGFETIGGVSAGLLCFFAVKVPGRLGFVRGIDDFGHAGLHAVGHLVLRDAGFDFGIEFAAELFVVQLVGSRGAGRRLFY